MDAELAARVRAWIAEDPDPETRAAALAHLEAGDEDWLREGFDSRLAFGTAGLRGEIGPGPNRMNRCLVRQVTAGLGSWLSDRPGPVVIGFDGRRGSATFARDAAQVLASHGRAVHLYDRLVATPELAFAVVALGAAAGIMVTASHNPPQDNGYKVYDANGAQVLPPHDTSIAAASLTTPTPPEGPLTDLVRGVPAAVREAWFTRILATRVRPPATARPLRVVYTAMHGVGYEPIQALWERAGLPPVIPVSLQVEPDGAFPTVRFPNPEEPGALDLALATAEQTEADLVIANDPDADRLAVVVRHRGQYVALSGNAVGILLADAHLAAEGTDRPKMVATTIVSTAMLGPVAEAHGAERVETLTGFKWIGNAALAHEARGGAFILGFEEALGYSVGSTVRDKDGVGTALFLVDRATALAADGRTLVDAMDDLYRQHGVFVSVPRSLTRKGADGLREIAARMDRLRSSAPRELAGTAVAAIRDIGRGERLDLASGERTPIDLPSSNVLAFDLADGSRALVRPSGTEPKVKFYVEVRQPVDGGDVAAAKAAGMSRAGLIADALVAASEPA